MNSAVDFFFDKEGKWHEAFSLLRMIVLDCGLTEELKWGNPCYLYEKRNVVLIHGFKDYCALLFFKGALLNDTDKLLIQQTENVQAARQIRFTSASEIKRQSAILKEYIFRAIEIEKRGLKVPLKKTADFAMPDEFLSQLAADPALKQAFEKLTPGRQRAYALHFSAPKQAATRLARIEKNTQRILDGKGLLD